MLMDYLYGALKKARYELLPEERAYYGQIPGFKGVWAEAKSLEACRTELAEVLEDWVLLRVSRGLTLPKVNGRTLRIKAVA